MTDKDISKILKLAGLTEDSVPSNTWEDILRKKILSIFIQREKNNRGKKPRSILSLGSSDIPIPADTNEIIQSIIDATKQALAETNIEGWTRANSDA